MIKMKTKICPRCGSENIEWIIPQNWSMWSCNNCDYTGPVIEVDEAAEKQLQENWKNHKNEILNKNKNDEDDEEDDLSDEELEEKLDKLFDD